MWLENAISILKEIQEILYLTQKFKMSFMIVAMSERDDLKWLENTISILKEVQDISYLTKKSTMGFMTKKMAKKHYFYSKEYQSCKLNSKSTMSFNSKLHT